jgi:hypothetical protein
MLHRPQGTAEAVVALEYLIMLIPVGAAAALEAVHRRRASRFGSFFSARDGFSITAGRRPLVRLNISADHGVLQAAFPPESWWRITGGPHPLAARTSLRILREGDVARLAAWLAEDVLVGAPPFDDNYRISGSHQDVVRGVLAVPEVRHAVVRVFNQARRSAVITLESERFLVEIAAGQKTPEELLGVMLAVKGLYLALAQHAQAAAVHSPGNAAAEGASESGVGSHTGSPVAVPPRTRR